MALMALPKFILLKSTENNKYLRYRKERDSNHTILQFSQDENDENVEIQYAKFEVQTSQTVQGFVHIRSCYNNKYWVRKSQDSKWIAADANEPEEDASKWSCTLFKAVALGDTVDDVDTSTATDVSVEAGVAVDLPQMTKPQRIRLVHSDQLGEHACVQSNTDLVIGGDEEGGSRASSSEADVFIAYDAASLVVLPERVSFIGGNERYGVPITNDSWTFAHLEFEGTAIGDRGVVNIPTQQLLSHPQTVQFQNTSLLNTANNGWWSRTIHSYYRVLGFVVLLETHNTGRLAFTPIRLGGNQLVLHRPLGGATEFAHVGSVFGPASMGVDNLLLIGPTTLNQSAIFSIVEPILFRQIRNVNYDLDDSRVYNITSVQKFRDWRINNTSIEQEGTFQVTYETSTTTSWEDSVTVARSLSASMSASIPFVGISFGVELSASQETTFVWGNEVTTTDNVSYGQSVKIPPRKSITLTVVATRAQCNVPFTCDVNEVVTDGEIRNYRKTDGIFLGANEFNFQTHLLEEDL